jgi:uncharacterized membrane protein YphA (DoxX/SURF4 family)
MVIHNLLITFKGGSGLVSYSFPSISLANGGTLPSLQHALYINPYIPNHVAMVIGSGLAIAKKHTEVGCGALGVSVLIQTIGYGLFFNLSVMFRNLSILGGLMILLADSYMTTKKRNFVFAGIPSMNEDEKTMYLMLLGRIFLVGLLFSFIMNGEFTVLRACVIFLSFISCVLVIVGFKAKSSAWVLIALMGIGNLVLNNFWSLHHNDHNRDFIQVCEYEGANSCKV